MLYIIIIFNDWFFSVFSQGGKKKWWVFVERMLELLPGRKFYLQYFHLVKILSKLLVSMVIIVQNKNSAFLRRLRLLWALWLTFYGDHCRTVSSTIVDSQNVSCTEKKTVIHILYSKRYELRHFRYIWWNSFFSCEALGRQTGRFLRQWQVRNLAHDYRLGDELDHLDLKCRNYLLIRYAYLFLSQNCPYHSWTCRSIYPKILFSSNINQTIN